VGLDLSEQNVKYLRETFVDPRISFIHGDAESAVPDGEFDLAISSLVFKHIFPSFERALANIASRLNAGGLACFDLIEGDARYFEQWDEVTYIRHYSRPEISAILERCGLTLVAFDEVAHDAEHRRLLVVARK
jgi:SAM-dependent methyltransferase